MHLLSPFIPYIRPKQHSATYLSRMPLITPWSHHHSHPATHILPPTQFTYTPANVSNPASFSHNPVFEMPPSLAACLHTPYLAIPCTRTAHTSLLPPTLLVEAPSPSSKMPSDVTCPPQRTCGKPAVVLKLVQSILDFSCNPWFQHHTALSSQPEHSSVPLYNSNSNLNSLFESTIPVGTRTPHGPM